MVAPAWVPAWKLECWAQGLGRLGFHWHWHFAAWLKCELASQASQQPEGVAHPPWSQRRQWPLKLVRHPRPPQATLQEGLGQ